MSEPKKLFAPKLSILSEATAARDALRLPIFWSRTLKQLPSGSEYVMCIPGYMAGGWSMAPLRRTLSGLGHRALPWKHGLNRGRLSVLVNALLAEFEQYQDTKIHLVGWSLGGLVARQVARLAPHRIAQVITLGTPVQGGPKYTAVVGVYRKKGYDLESLAAAHKRREAIPIPVPITAIYSRNDHFVCPAACIDSEGSHVHHIELQCSHTGLVIHPAAHTAIAELLSKGTRDP